MSPRILLVDDELARRGPLAEALRRAGHEVEEASSFPEAERSLQRRLPEVLIVELLLPGDASGFAVLEAARRLAPARKLPALAMSDVYTSRHGRQDLLERFGLIDVLQRPFEAELLVARLGEALAAPPSIAAAADEAPGSRPAGKDAPAPAPRPADDSTQPDWHVPRSTVPEQTVVSASGMGAERVLTPLAPLYAGRLAATAGPPTTEPDAAASPASAATDVPEQWLRGELQQTPFPALLAGLHRLRATGALYLRQERKKKVVYFVDGGPGLVKSNLLQECLGRILVREGMISEDELDESVARMKARAMLQGQALVEMGSISERNLTYGLQRQLESKLLELFGWSYGAFRFAPGELAGGSGVPPTASVGELVHEGLLRFYPAERVAKERAALTGRRLLRVAESQRRDLTLGLSPAEEALRLACDGGRTTEQLLSQSELPTEAAERLLLTLVHCGVIEPSA